LSISDSKSPGRVDIAIISAVVASSFICWLPLISPYIFFADDFHFGDQRIADFFLNYGVWRFFGLCYLKILLTLGGWVPGAVTMLLHATTSVLFYCVLRQATVPQVMAFLGAIALAVCPAAFEAMTWVAASFIIPATALFLASLWISGSRFFNTRPVLQFLMLVLLTLVANLFQENLFFAFLLVPFWWAIIDRSRSMDGLPLIKKVNLSALFGVGLGLGVYLVAHHFFPGSSPYKILNWHSRALLSSVGYQATGIFAFEPLFRRFAYSYLELLPWKFLAPAGSFFLAILVLSLSRLRPENVHPDNSARIPGRVTMGWLVALFLTGSIYALAGGMSLDSRKTYAFLPSLVGVFVLPPLGWMKVANWRNTHIRLFAIIMVIICAMTTWLIVAFWQSEVLRGQRLADRILRDRVSGAIRLVNTDQRKDLFRYFTRKLGASVDDEEGINARLHGKARISLSNSPAATTLVYSNGDWHVVRDL
jgi:hypothetical protein